MLTLDGTLVLPTNTAVPSLPAIATGLCRMPRFGGQTRRWWTVLHHSMLVGKLAHDYAMNTDLSHVSPGAAPLQLEAILIGTAVFHDAHEAMTGDVPTTWKTADLRRRQQALDERLFQTHLGIAGMPLWAGPLVAEFDRRALVAEAAVVGPTGFAAAEPELPAPLAEDMELVERLSELMGPVGGAGLHGGLMVRFIQTVQFAKSQIAKYASYHPARSLSA